jgi:ribosome-associated protein
MSSKKKRLEITIQHVKGGGPGGQHRNKRQTGIVATHVPTGLTVRSTELRSQGQNLSRAISRLETKVEAHFYRPPSRKKTQKSKGSHKLRIQKKIQHGAKKKLRQKRHLDE